MCTINLTRKLKRDNRVGRNKNEHIMKYKISLLLDEDDINLLIEFSNTTDSVNLKSQIVSQASLIKSDEYIKHHVYLALADISGKDYSFISDEKSLKTDLGLSLYHKRSLKNYFQKIVSDLNSNKIITVKECEDLIAVKNCLTLVKSKV